MEGEYGGIREEEGNAEYITAMMMKIIAHNSRARKREGERGVAKGGIWRN